MSKINEIIELSVGGQMFKTTRRTLVSEPNSLLANMFEFTDDSANIEAKNEENGALHLFCFISNVYKQRLFQRVDIF